MDATEAILAAKGEILFAKRAMLAAENAKGRRERRATGNRSAVIVRETRSADSHVVREVASSGGSDRTILGLRVRRWKVV